MVYINPEGVMALENRPDTHGSRTYVHLTGAGIMVIGTASETHKMLTQEEQ